MPPRYPAHIGKQWAEARKHGDLHICARLERDHLVEVGAGADTLIFDDGTCIFNSGRPVSPKASLRPTVQARL